MQQAKIYNIATHRVAWLWWVLKRDTESISGLNIKDEHGGARATGGVWVFACNGERDFSNWIGLFFTQYYLLDMINSLIKLKLLKLTIVGAIVGGIVAGTVASVIAKEMCKRKKKTSKEK